MINTKVLSNTTVTVGIMGCANGVGTTHLAIMLAGFLSSKEHKKTALIELNHTGAFTALNDLYCEKDINSDEIGGKFSLNGVAYYPNQTDASLAMIFQLEYEYIILDLGSETDRNFNELLRCSVCCIVGSLSEWKISLFEKMIFRLHQFELRDSFHFVTAFGIQKFKKTIEKKYHIKIDTIPFEPTPFLLHKETFTFFERLCS